VATPRTWEEVEAGAAAPGALSHATADDVLDRVERLGDLVAVIL
jgi:bifunctional non-homologous end joining protein LigD